MFLKKKGSEAREFLLKKGERLERQRVFLPERLTFGNILGLHQSHTFLKRFSLQNRFIFERYHHHGLHHFNETKTNQLQKLVKPLDSKKGLPHFEGNIALKSLDALTQKAGPPALDEIVIAGQIHFVNFLQILVKFSVFGGQDRRSLQAFQGGKSLLFS